MSGNKTPGTSTHQIEYDVVTKSNEFKFYPLTWGSDHDASNEKSEVSESSILHNPIFIKEI